MPEPANGIIDFGSLDARTTELETFLGGDTLSFQNLEIQGNIRDADQNPYLKAVGTDGKVEFETLDVTGNLVVGDVRASQILSDDIRTTDGLSFLRLSFGRTGTGRSEPTTTSIRTEAFRDMVVDGDFVQFNGTMRGNGKFLTSFAERENQNLERRLSEYAKFSDRRVFVSATDGNDQNHGRSWDQAVKTIKRACEIAEPRTTIFVASGDYYEEVPIYVKPNVSIIGDSLRTAFLYTKSWEFRERHPSGRGERAVPVGGINYNRLDYFHVGSSVYLVGLRFKHLQSPGYCVAFPCAIVDVGVNNGGLANPVSPTSSNLPVLYSPEGYYTEPRPLAGPFYEWQRNPTGEKDRFKNARITQIIVSDSGQGYSVDTRIDIAPPDVVAIEPNAGTRARARVQNVDPQGGIRAVEVTDPGRGYNDEALEQRKNVSAEDGSGLGNGAVLSPVYTSESYTAWSEEGGVKRPAGRVFTSPSSVEVTTSLVRGIAGYIQRRGTEFPTFARTNPGFYFDVADTIEPKRATYQDRVLSFVQNAFPGLLTVDQQALCRRDVGLLVDAVVADLRRGGYDASLRAAQSYYVGGASVLSEGTVQPTVRAVETLADLLRRTVLNDVIQQYPYQAAEGYTSRRVYRALTGDETYDADKLYPEIRPRFASSVTGDVRAYPGAASILRERRETLQDEVMQWTLDQSFSFWTTLIQEKCRRDVGFLVDALVSDLQMGGALASLRAAQTYYFGMRRLIGETQLQPTLGAIEHLMERIEIVPGLSEPAVEKARGLLKGVRETLAFPETYDPPHIVLELGVPAFLARFPTDAQTHTGGYDDAAALLARERTTIQTEVMAFVDDLIAQSEGGFQLNTRQRDLCRRDTGLIVDGLASDLKTGGCSRTVESANAYYVGRTTNRVFADDQIDPTIASIRFVRQWLWDRDAFEGEAGRIAHLLLEGLVLTLRVPTQTKRLRVSFLNLDAGGSVADQSGGYDEAADALMDQRAAFQTDVVAWVDRFFPDLFTDPSTRTKCARDVGLIVDAIVHDIRFGGARRTEAAAIAYYRGRASVLPDAQRGPTIQSLSYFGTEMIARVAQSDAGLADVISKLMLTLTNTIDDATFVGGVNPVFDEGAQNDTNHYPVASAALVEAREALQDEVMTYVTTEHADAIPSVQSQETCRRDVGFLIDAVARDLDERGYVRSAFAAAKYYEGTQRQIPPNQLDPTVSAVLFLKERMHVRLDAAQGGLGAEPNAKDRVAKLIEGIATTLRAPEIREDNDFPRPLQYVAYQLVDANLSKWRLEGSVGNGAWTVLDARDYTDASSATYPESGRFGIANPGRYTRYRLVMLQNKDNRVGRSAYMHVTQLQFFEISPPQVFVDGPDIQNTKVRSVEVQTGGLGYVPESTTVALLPEPGDDSPSEPAEADAIVENGRVRRIVVRSGGRGYEGRARAVVTDSSGGGSGATALVIMEDDYAKAEVDAFDAATGKITNVRIVDRGSGYTNPPTVSITAPERLRPIVTASPYVQNCSNISGPWDTQGWRVFETHPLPFPLDDIYQDPADRREIDPEGSGGGIRIDGACPRIGSPLRSFVVDAFTQVNQGGVGFLLTNLAYAQFVSTFGTFCSTHMRAIGGSFANASNSVTDFGTKGLEAKGYWPEPFSKGRVIAPGDPDDPEAPTTWQAGSGLFVPGLGYRSELVNLTIDTFDQTFDRETDRLFVEIDPPVDDEELTQTARVSGLMITQQGRRRIVELNNDVSLSNVGELENIVLEGQTYPDLGYGQTTQEYRGVGYKTVPNVTVRLNDPLSGPIVPSESTPFLSNVASIRIAILEGRRPDFLSIARIHGEWYTVQGVNPVAQIIDGVSRVLPGYFDVLFFPAPPYVDLDFDVDFHSVSYLSTGSHVMEYVGSGITYNALPEYGGIPDSGAETNQVAPAKVFYTTSDQLGNSKVGPLFEVNQATGQIALDATSFDLRNLAGIGPFVRNGVVVGAQIREVSNNPELRSSLGAPDAETVPTQNAVVSYVQRRSVPEPSLAESGKFLRADVSQRDAQGRAFAWQNLNLNEAVSIDIQRVSLSTDVLTGLYIDGEARVYGDVLCDQMLITEPTKEVAMPFGSMSVRVQPPPASEPSDPPTLVFRYRNAQGAVFRASVPFEPE